MSAYSARVLEDHVARPKPLTPVAEDLKAAKDRLFYGILSVELVPKGVLDRIDAASGGQFAFACALIDEVKPTVLEAGATVLAAIDKYDRFVFWHEQTGLPHAGRYFDAFEAAWAADNRILAKEIAAQAVAEIPD